MEPRTVSLRFHDGALAAKCEIMKPPQRPRGESMEEVHSGSEIELEEPAYLLCWPAKSKHDA